MRMIAVVTQCSERPDEMGAAQVATPRFVSDLARRDRTRNPNADQDQPGVGEENADPKGNDERPDPIHLYATCTLHTDPGYASAAELGPGDNQEAVGAALAATWSTVGYAPRIWTVISRFRGPSSSAKMIDWKRPSVRSPLLTPTAMLRPSSAARRWEWALPRSQSEKRGSSWRYPVRSGTRRSIMPFRSSTRAAWNSLMNSAQVVWRVLINAMPVVTGNCCTASRTSLVMSETSVRSSLCNENTVLKAFIIFVPSP